MEASYTDDEGETVDIPAEDLAKEDTFDIKVVEPITLSVTLTNESVQDLTEYGEISLLNLPRAEFDKKLDELVQKEALKWKK